MSTIASGAMGWIDFSSDDRDRVRLALRKLSEPGTLDELGIGVMRDAFADCLFPGLSTIQTRAKYLVTVPRILRDFMLLQPAEKRRLTPSRYLRDQEDVVAATLTTRHQEEKENGIIGTTKVEGGEGVARRPSSIYWGALRTWGIVDTTASLTQFLGQLASPEQKLGSQQEDEPDDADGDLAFSRIRLDKLDGNWLDQLVIHLTASEARFLHERFLQGPVDSLPTQLLQQGLLEEALEDHLGSFSQLAAWGGRKLELSPVTRKSLLMAEEFSQLIHGAHIRFNCILSRKGHAPEEVLLEWERLWARWSGQRQVAPDQVDCWLLHTQAKLRSGTVRFLHLWSQALREGQPVEYLDDLVSRQADENKGARSLIHKALPPPYKWVGMSVLDFRWAQVRVILGDLKAGLAC